MTMQNSMNVLHISGATSWGGNEQQLLYLINELPKYDVQQYLLCFRKSRLKKEASKLNVDIIDVNPVKPFNYSYLKKIRDIVKFKKIDVIHLHTSDSVTAYVLCDLLFKLKTPTLFARKGIRRSMGFLSKQKYNYKNIDRILCVSKYVEKHFKNDLYPRNHRKLVVVYNGVERTMNVIPTTINLRDKLNISDEIFLIGNIANHTNAKDLPTLIKTINYLVSDLGFTNFHVVQIGELSKNTSELIDMIKKLELEKYITFLGFTPNASTLQKQLDVFFMTSEREGGPSSIIEAFSNHTAVISTKVGVVDEVIIEGHNGYTAEIKDFKTLAQKIFKLAHNTSLKDKFRDRSFLLYKERFTAENLGKSTYNVYTNMNLKFRN